jgi:ABC-type branched-subunit amino acid transport system substrate-binding protein
MAELSLSGQARRFLIAAGGAALFALGLAGCDIVPTPRPETATEQPAPAKEEERVEPETQRPDVPAEAVRHRVAVLVPLTGANAGVGQSLANAANLALLDTGGERIRLTVYDTAKAGAAAAAAQAVAEGNGLFLGPLLAEDVRTAAAVARRADIPIISFSNDVSVAGNGVYLMGFTPSQAISRVVGYARERGVTSFGGVAPEGTYGRRAAEGMQEALERSDARLVGFELFDRGPGALRTAISRLHGRGTAQAVLIADAGRTAALAAPLLKAAPYAGTRLLGTELWAAETTLGRTPALRGAWYATVSDTLFNQVRTKYRTRYGANPYRLASLGYDAVLLAVRTAKEWRPGRAFPEGQLRDREGFIGIDGPFRFDSSGVAQRSLEVREVTASGTIVLSPAPRSFD